MHNQHNIDTNDKIDMFDTIDNLDSFDSVDGARHGSTAIDKRSTSDRQHRQASNV